MVSIQSKYLCDGDIKQLASLLPFITNSTNSQPFTDSREQALKVAEAIDQLIVDLDLESTLQEYNVPKSDFEQIIEKALPNGRQDERFEAFVELLQSVY